MDKSFVDEFIDSSISANKEIYNLLLSQNKILKESKTKGFGGDISLNIDLECEKIFIKHLSKYGKIFSEESGEVGDGKFTIVIDPLDGSDNFLSNIPYYGTSIALTKNGEVLVGIVVNLVSLDVFVKTKESFKRGSLFSKNEYKCVKKNSFSKVGIYEKGYQCSSFSKKLGENKIKYRVTGAIALSLAYAYDVSFVIFEGKIREFDVCAGKFMCSELFIYESGEILIVSKDRNVFERLVGCVK
jgi:myo-inositol-1(or 4)-monophosphatase